MYRLPDIPIPLDFPDDFRTSPEGILAVGGNLLPETLVNAYSRGLFPWFNREDPILWWHPDPRLVLYPSEVRLSTSMRKLMRKVAVRGASDPATVRYRVTENSCFERVMCECAEKRGDGREDTWITKEMIDSYATLHANGFAQSIETWTPQGDLVGGLYGVSIGKVFFGESMFSHESNASKIALVHLCRRMHESGYVLLDCQVATEHLISLGAQKVSRREFLKKLEEGESFLKRRGAALGK